MFLIHNNKILQFADKISTKFVEVMQFVFKKENILESFILNCAKIMPKGCYLKSTFDFS